MNLILYGPPASGKTTVGRALAQRLGREFVDTDEVLAQQAGMTIPDIFSSHGEQTFREWESAICRRLARDDKLVIACGGGALLNAETRSAMEETGRVVCLDCAPGELLRRMNGGGARPLLAGPDPAAQLQRLLETRRAVYASFPLRVDTTGRTVAQVVEAVLSLLRSGDQPARQVFHVERPAAYDIVLGSGLLATARDECCRRGFQSPAAVVSDSNVAPLHAERVADALGAKLVTFPAGEAHKTLDTVRVLYDALLDAGIERGGAIAALGGGVVGDMAGFAAATLLRGVSWINLPTTLLAMVDAGIGGKVGVDLPQGKNLVGAFHMPALVLADLDALNTLPEDEFRSGMAEVVKAGVIGDAGLFECLETEGRRLEIGNWRLDEMIAGAIRVKVGIVESDPYERSGERAKLSLGHTIGHGVEAASGYALRHGQAVAVGLVAESLISERIGLAESGLAARIAAVLTGIGLPVRAPGLAPEAIRAAMNADKKKQNSRLTFALLRRVGEVVTGIQVEDALLDEILHAITIDPG